MQKVLTVALLLTLSIFFSSCSSENYSNGQRIGLITQFSRTGIFNKSWEGHLNLTQTGMNSSSAEPFDFSIDNDHEDQKIINIIDSAAQHGWKVKLIYHEVFMKNWFNNRGETNHFISSVEVLDKEPVKNAIGRSESVNKGRVDTIYLVIYRDR